MKNRESAQISRDRKRQQESSTQQDLLLLTEENKHLQMLLKAQQTCEQCGHQNSIDKNQEITNPQISEFNQKENNRSLQDFFDFSKESSDNKSKEMYFSKYISATKEIFETKDFFDIKYSSAQNNSNQQKGMWNTTLIIFLLYMLIVFSATNVSSEAGGVNTLEYYFRDLPTSGPYQHVFEMCKGLTHDELLECLLTQLQTRQQSTNNSENPTFLQTDFISKNFIRQQDCSNNINDKQEEYLQQMRQQKGLQDFIRDYRTISGQNEGNYYNELNEKLDALLKEKLGQIENLKRVYFLNNYASKSFDEDSHYQHSLMEDRCNNLAQLIPTKDKIDYFFNQKESLSSTEDIVSSPKIFPNEKIDFIHNRHNGLNDEYYFKQENENQHVFQVRKQPKINYYQCLLKSQGQNQRNNCNHSEFNDSYNYIKQNTIIHPHIKIPS